MPGSNERIVCPTCDKIEKDNEWEHGPYEKDHAVYIHCPVCAGVINARAAQRKWRFRIVQRVKSSLNH